MVAPVKSPPSSPAVATVGKGADKRVFPRTLRTSFVWYHSLTRSSEAHGLSHSVALSRGGFGIVAQHRMTVNELVFIEAVLPAGRFDGVCRVAYCKPGDSGTYRVGLEFRILPPSAVELLGQLIG